MSIEAMKQALEALLSAEAEMNCEYGATELLRQAIEQAEKNQFNPDWDAMAVMVEEQQRMAKRIEDCEALARTVMMDQTAHDTHTAAQREWVGLMRGVRVDGDTVVITVKGGNESARQLCAELLKEKNT